MRGLSCITRRSTMLGMDSVVLSAILIVAGQFLVKTFYNSIFEAVERQVEQKWVTEPREDDLEASQTIAPLPST